MSTLFKPVKKQLVVTYASGAKKTYNLSTATKKRRKKTTKKRRK